MKKLWRITAVALLVAMLLSCVAAFAGTEESVKAEQYICTDIDDAGAELSLEKVQEQSDEAFLTLYENEQISIGGRDGLVVDITIFGGDYTLFGVAVGMTVEEAKAKLDEQEIAYREDQIVEIGQQELVFDVPGFEGATGCFDLNEGVVGQANIFVEPEEDEAAEPAVQATAKTAAKATAKPASKATKPKAENGYIKLTGSAHLRKNADKESSSLKILENGTKLKFSATAKDYRGVTWYKVTSGNKTGWVSSKYSKKISKSEYEKKGSAPKSNTSNSGAKKANGYIRLTGQVNVRKDPNKDSKSLSVFAAGSELKYTATAKDSRGVVWYKVSAGGVTGWISSKNAKKIK